MSELEIFTAALPITDLSRRAEFLHQTCGSDVALRRRIEILLRNHEDAGSFLAAPLPVADSLAGQEATESFGQQPRSDAIGAAIQPRPETAPTQGELTGADGSDALEFLQPSTKSGSLGRLGHYEVLEVLGHGGFGVVVRAFDEKLQRVVAIKVLSAQLAATSPARRRYLREARASAKVRQEHVVQIYAVEEQPIPYLVMEYIPGRTLQQKLDANGPLDVPEMLRLAVQIARGLAAAHAQGLIHRDIKPGNILLEEALEAHAKITDFGLARAADDASLTQSGVVAGTPMYMAPEQAEGKSIDQRADLFSLGSVFYVMLSGRPPFRASGTMAVLKRVCEDMPRPIREIIPEVPEWLEGVIAKLHAKKPDERFQTAAEVADLLSQHLAHLQQPQLVPQPVVPSVVPRSESRDTANEPAVHAIKQAPPRRRWKRMLAAAVVLAAVAIGTTYFVMRPAIEPPIPPLERTDRYLDSLRREDIPRGLLALAGGGDPDQAPPELVAMLGDGRFRGLGSFSGWMALHANMLAVPAGNTVCLFEADTGKFLRTLVGHTARIPAAAFSPDGNRIATTSDDQTIRLWDPATGAEVLRLKGTAGILYAMAFSPDSKRITAGVGTKQIVWDASTGDEIFPLEGEMNSVRTTAFSPDSTWIVSGDGKTVKVWHADTGKAHTAQLPLDGGLFHGVAFSKDGKLLATGSDREVKVWDGHTFDNKAAFSVPGHWLAFTPDGKTLLAANHSPEPDGNHKVARLDLATGTKVDWLSYQSSTNPPVGNNHGIHQLSADGKTLFATRVNAEPLVRAFDIETGKEQFPRQGHAGHVLSVAVSPDGKLLASGGDDRIVRVWNLAEWKTGKPLPPVRTFPGHADVVWCVAFSPDGKFLASSSGDHTITLWDLESGGDAQTLPGAAGVAVRMAFSPDGRSLVAGCEDGGVRSWQLPGDKEPVLLCRHAARVRCVAFSPDGTLMASGGDDRQVWVSEVRTSRRRHAFTLPTIVNNVAFSPDGRTLAATGDAPDGAVHLWDVAQWKEVRLPGHTNHIHGLAFSLAAPLIATGGHDGTLRFWDLSRSALARGEPMQDAPPVLTLGPGPFGNAVYNVAFTPKGGYLVTANGNGTISILKTPTSPPPYDPGSPRKLPDPLELAKRPSPADNLQRKDIPVDLFINAGRGKVDAPPELVAILAHGDKGITSVAISPDGKLLASGGGDNQSTKIWELATGKLLQTLPTPGVYEVAFVPIRGTGADARLLLATTAGNSRTTKLWDVQTGQASHTLTGHIANGVRLAAAPDGRWLASADQSGMVRVWDPATGKLWRTLQRPPGDWGDLAASPDSRLLATADSDGLVRLWDPLSGWLLARLEGHQGPVRGLAFLADGRTLASSSNYNRDIRLWDLATLKQTKLLEGTRTRAIKLAWRADGRLLASDDANGNVRLWDPSADSSRHQALPLFPAVGDSLHGIAMTPEGRYLATANPDGTIYILRLAERGVVFTPGATDEPKK